MTELLSPKQKKKLIRVPTGSSFSVFFVRSSSFSGHLNVGGLRSSYLGFIFNYIYIPLQGNFIQTHCLNRGFANLYLQLQGCSLP